MPQPLKILSGQNFKIKQTACEMWNFLRLFPLMIGTNIEKNEPVWVLVIKFIQIVERLTALSFDHDDLVILELYIKEFFELYGKLFPDSIFKPKSHFLKHYPAMIRRFGPLVKTLRFEAKHSYFKQICQITNNRKNICQTLAKRHQYKIYLHHCKREIIDHQTIPGSGMEELFVKSLDYLSKVLLKEQLGLSDAERLCKMTSVLLEGQNYYVGNF